MVPICVKTVLLKGSELLITLPTALLSFKEYNSTSPIFEETATLSSPNTARSEISSKISMLFGSESSAPTL